MSEAGGSKEAWGWGTVRAVKITGSRIVLRIKPVLQIEGGGEKNNKQSNPDERSLHLNTTKEMQMQ